jgi:hypothetical protein
MTVSDLQEMERQYRSVPFLDIMAEIASLRAGLTLSEDERRIVAEALGYAIGTGLMTDEAAIALYERLRPEMGAWVENALAHP